MTFGFDGSPAVGASGLSAAPRLALGAPWFGSMGAAPPGAEADALGVPGALGAGSFAPPQAVTITADRATPIKCFCFMLRIDGTFLEASGARSYWTFVSSISKTSAALGGIWPLPLDPYARFAGT